MRVIKKPETIQVNTTEHRSRLRFLQVFLVAEIATILILTAFAKHYAFFPFDLYITKQIQLINFFPFEQLLLFLSWLGNFYPTVGSLIVGFLVLYSLKRKDLAIGLTVSAVGAVVISETLKRIVNRPRPDPSLIHQIEKFTRDDSFPSGHVLYFIGFYGFLLVATYTSIKSKLWRNIISAVLLIMIILIGISRIYKGSHWFSDTLASYLIGSIWLYLMVLLLRKITVQLKSNGK
jgi:membrane-associated phospholipid phosphatase